MIDSRSPIAPPAASTFTREYPTDADYQTDSRVLVRSGWRVITIQRTPIGAILATYAAAPVTSNATPATTHENIAASTKNRWLETLVRIKRHLSMRWFIGGIIGGAVVVGLLVGLLISSLASNTSPSTGASPSAVSVSATETANTAYAASLNATATAFANVPTATPAPVMVAGAHIGGPIDDFDAAYGPEVSQDTWDTTIAGQDVQLMVSLTHLGDSRDSQDRTVIIDISQQSGSAWSASEDAAIVGSFMPSDASHVRTLSGWSNLGPDHIYLSHQLATSLVASVFQNSANQLLTPGTFDWQCSTSTAMCEIAVGTNS